MIKINNKNYKITNKTLLKNRSKFFNIYYNNNNFKRINEDDNIIIPIPFKNNEKIDLIEIILKKIQNEKINNLEKIYSNSLYYFILINLADYIQSNYIINWLNDILLNYNNFNYSIEYTLIIYYNWLNYKLNKNIDDIELFQNKINNFNELIYNYYINKIKTQSSNIDNNNLFENILNIYKYIYDECIKNTKINELLVLRKENLLIDLYSIKNYIPKYKKYTKYKYYEAEKPKLFKIINLDKFTENFKNLTHNIFDNFNWDNIILSGGIMFNLITINNIFMYNRNSDIDLFIYGENNDIKKERAKYICEYLKGKFENNIYFIENTNVITVIIRDKINSTSNPIRNIQIILTNYKNAYDIISNFDHTCIQILYNGEKILTTRKFLKYIQYNMSKILKLTTPERYKKIYNNGLNILQRFKLNMYVEDNGKIENRKYHHINDEKFLKKQFMIDKINKCLNKYYYPTNYDNTLRINTFINYIFKQNTIPINKLKTIDKNNLNNNVFYNNSYIFNASIIDIYKEYDLEYLSFRNLFIDLKLSKSALNREKDESYKLYKIYSKYINENNFKSRLYITTPFLKLKKIKILNKELKGNDDINYIISNILNAPSPHLITFIFFKNKDSINLYNVLYKLLLGIRCKIHYKRSMPIYYKNELLNMDSNNVYINFDLINYYWSGIWDYYSKSKISHSNGILLTNLVEYLIKSLNMNISICIKIKGTYCYDKSNIILPSFTIESIINNNNEYLINKQN
jgi:hypothetical protein